MATDPFSLGDATEAQRTKWKILARTYDRMVAVDRAEWHALAFVMFATIDGVLYPMTPGQCRVVDEEFARRHDER